LSHRYPALTSLISTRLERDKLREFSADSLSPMAWRVNATNPILWRSFHFHAYFPFPPRTSQPLGYSAFRRAIALLASTGDSHLAINANGGSLHPDLAFDKHVPTSSRLWRVFRSLAVRLPYPKEPGMAESRQAVPPEVQDLFAVLALV